VWKTTNSGGNWTPTFDDQSSLAIGSIASDPQNPSIIYAGTGEAHNGLPVGSGGTQYFGAGIFRSTNGGTSWSKIGGATFNTCYVSNVVVKPGSSSTLFVGVVNQGTYLTSCSSGIYRSLNGGSTWTKVISGRVTDLVTKPGTASTLYAGFWGSGVWKSTTNGDAGSWVKLTGGLPTAGLGRIAVSVTAANPARVYAAFTTSAGQAVGVYTSGDSGTSWAALPFRDFCNYPDGTSASQCGYDLAIVAYPANQNFVYVGGIYIARFDGTKWTTLGYSQTNGVHVDIQSLSFDSSNRLWVGSDGGAYLKAGSTTGFTNLNGTLGITQFYPGTTGTPGSLFLGGTQDNGNIQRSGGSWSQYFTGDGGYTAYDSADRYRFHEYIAAEAWRTDSLGNHVCLFTTIADDAPGCGEYHAEASLFIAPFIQSPTGQRTLFLGTNRIWKTTDAGATWAAVSNQFAGKVSAIAQSRSNSSVMYAAWTGNSSTHPFVAYTTNGGANWFSTAALPNRFITDVQVKSSAPNVAWATLSGYNTSHIFLTQDYGAHWTDISSNLPNAPINRLAVDSRTSPSRLYVASDVGVFWSTDGGASWGNTSVGLPNSVVMDIRVDAASNTLVAATYGRGAFSAPLP
jgi:hypothetical protein